MHRGRDVESWQLNYEAAWSCLKQIAARIGKSYEWCRRQCRPSDQADYYGAFLVWWYAILAVNPPAANLYINDLVARRDAALGRDGLAGEDWAEAVATAAEATGEAIAEATRRSDPAAVERKVSDAVASMQRLLALNRAHHARGEARPR